MDTNLTVCCYLVVIIFTCALRAQALDLGDIPTFPDVVPMPLEEACMRYLSGCKAKTNYTDDPSKQLQVLKSCMVQNSCPRLSEEFLNKVVYVEKKHKPGM
ncbi:unnamed protein product [Lymnaea stagnalis]|uniref:Uncharacterized protein n=1 Tax=Lymnaea stagnalis TaxID=6523 RepID=A0AAV2HEC2_LYMST